MARRSLLSVLLGLALLIPGTTSSNCTVPGLVDLGYAKHVPSFTNTTDSGKNVTIYRDIRFGNPPVGDLRFRRPDTARIAEFR